MRAIDTNLLVRLITRDDARQVEAAEAFVAKGAWVSHLVLAETAWVLESVYELSAHKLGDAIEMLLDHGELVVERADVAGAALAQFRKRPGLGYTDCLVLESARSAGHLPLGTFDKGLASLDGTERVGPRR
jgi:predicted nucleic-acid-binding protein